MKEDKVAERSNENDIPQKEKCEAEYELKVDAHIKVRNFDVVEAIEENYNGTLNDQKIDVNDPSRYILVQKIKEEPFENENEKRTLLSYRVFVNNNVVSKTLIESWKLQRNFDDLAFRNAVYDKIQVRIHEVKKIELPP